MTLATAHEGYEYQDLLTGYFILNEILEEREAEFIIDRKEYDNDKIDDLLIINKGRKFKKQVKYSNADFNHILSKSDLSTEGAYGLSIDTLYFTWLNHQDKDNTEFRICLSWQEPIDELTNILEMVNGKSTFSNFLTKVYKINGGILWPKNSSPLSSWRRFKTASIKIDRNLFLEFCDSLLIEVLMPKLSLNLAVPGELESVVIEQSKDLGIGIFPNNQLRPETFILSLLAIIKRSRSKGTSITIASIFHDLNIITDYGSIEQKFPVIESENVQRKSAIEKFIDEIEQSQKILLSGEPGSGKSWFIENLMNHIKTKKIRTIRHYCYTDLNDSLQKERIKLDVFYGNLISEIIQEFPELKKIKKQKFASNLNELNHLLLNIEEPTYLIVDGLDHIERIATFREFRDITIQDRAIIESLEKLKASQFVKIIVTSQNIPELGLIETFTRKTLSSWTENDIKQLLKKNKVRNKLLQKGLNISSFLFQKSKGNPLYLKYLMDEIKNLPFVSLTSLGQLPEYSFNLSEYYCYLLSQLNLREDVPQILSGVYFSLTKQELQEITHSGDHVGESLRILSPVLKLNFSQSGYSIYHESFRRYVIDHLKSKSISIDHKIFRPITEWFDSKNFFAYQKAYRYYLQFLSEGGSFEKTLSLLNLTFVTDSVVNGQSWDLIEKNYRIFVKAACHIHDFPRIILLNEIDKIISTCQDHFEPIYPLYLETLGKIHGFKYLSDYLLFEGSPTVPFQQGLEACYICDENDVVAPWSIYMEYFNEGKNVEIENFKYFVRGLLVTRNEQRLKRAADNIVKDLKSQYFDVFTNELNQYKNRDFIKILARKCKNIESLIETNSEPINSGCSIDKLFELADSIIAMDNVFTKEIPVIINFFDGLYNLIDNTELIDGLIRKFQVRNWFYNWIIYYIKIIKINSGENINYSDVKEAFDYLKYNTEPFLGQPRTCDLYSLHPFIYKSFVKGLSFIKTESEWKETIDTLIVVSNKTTTSLQRTITGPLATDKLFQLLSEFTCEDNISFINTVFEKLVDDNEDYHLHTDIAEYNLRLASIYAISENKNKAIEYFKKGVEFSLAYTMRKDLTLMDVIDGIEYFSKVNPEKGIEDLKKSRILIDSAVSHTDGKETNHFPVIWFERFLKVNFSKASLYLLNELKKTRYHWWNESNLINLLCHANGDINPEIEAFIALTFPIEDSENFIRYCLRLYEKIENTNPSLAKKLMDRTIAGMKPKHNRQRSDELITDFNSKLTEDTFKIIPKIKENKILKEFCPWYKNIYDRKNFSLMSGDEILIYFDENNIQESDLNSFSYVLDEFEELSDSAKELTKLIVFKNNRRYSDKLNLDKTFNTENDIECYYWVCRFVSDSGGWYQNFVNQEAFFKAHVISPEKAIIFLFELLPEYLEIGFNSSFSSNLIKLLVSLDYDQIVIEKCWENLLIVTSYRLPVQQDIDWEGIFDSDMTNEEVLLCILLCRFKAETSDRYKVTIMALEQLISADPSKLIKPFRWFLKNRTEFSRVSEIIILQYIYKQSIIDRSYHLNFKEDLATGYPTKYFIIDYIIGELYSLSISQIYNPKVLIYPKVSKGIFNFIYYMNYRFRIFQINEIDLNHTFNKYAATFNTKYHDYFELYSNRVHKKMIRHIYGSEYMMEIFNTECYEEFSLWKIWDEPEPCRLGTFIDTDAITVYANSCGKRPLDLKKPSQNEEETTVVEVFEGEWIRLGHIEHELKEQETFKTLPFKSYGGIVFSNDVETGIPFSSYALYPFHFWSERGIELDLEKNIIFSIIQEDPLEYFKLLWLNPKIVQLLELKVERNSDGLVALNIKGEKILIMRTWSCDYIGGGYNSSLYDEIPTLEGTDLIIRKDYFDRLCTLFKYPPRYYTRKIESAFT